MRAMKDSGIEWIGQVPESWESRSLKYALDAHSGGAWGSNEGGDETDVICVRVADFDYGKLSVDFHDKMTVRSYTEKAIAESSLKHGDILLEKSGGGEVTPVGRSVLFAGEEGMMCANFIEWLRPNQYFNSCFLNYWLAAAYINGFSKRNVKQTTGIQNLDIPAFLSEKIVAPSVIEQKQIAQYLDVKCAEIDALIEAKEKTNALLKERRQSIIYEAVTKGLNPDAPMKDSGNEWIGEIPENWGIAALKRVATPSTGMTPSKANSQYWEGDIPWFSSKDIKADYLFDSEDHISQQAVDECGLTVHDENSVVFCARSGILRHTFPVSVLKCKGTINQDLRVLAASETIDPEFLMYYLRGMNNTIVTLYQKVGATVESIEMEWLLYLPVVLPPIEEQKQIAEYIVARCNEIDGQIAANEVSVQKLKEYRQSIIYEAVTGKVEL